MKLDWDYLKFAGYVNGDGFVTVEQFAEDKPGEGNGLLQTGLALVIRAKLQGATFADQDNLVWLIEVCHHRQFPILWRSRWKKNPDDNQDWDDYYGVLAACYFQDVGWPKLFLAHCKRQGWCVNIQNPEKWELRFWFARSPGFKGFVKLCAGQEPSILNWLGIWSAMLVSCFTLASDACMRSYCFNSVASDRSFIANLINKLWFKRVRARYGTTGAAFSGYFKGMEHPLTQGDWS